MKIVILLLVLVTCSRDYYQVNGECFELVQQYYECKNLIMIKPNINSSTYLVPPGYTYELTSAKYEPIPSVPNNKLNDTFYQNLNLSQMTFDQAMDLFRTIYSETYNCMSDFCNCTRAGIIDYYKYGRYNRFSTFFTNSINFDQVKIILAEFIVKFQSNMLPYSSLEDFFKSKTHSNQTLPTLAQFCMKYDYTDERFRYYNDSFNCFNDDIFVDDCKWDEIVNDTDVNDDFGLRNEQLLSCDLINLKNCPVEKQRFFALTDWVQSFPNLVWTGQSLKDYFDGLINQASVYTPKMELVKSYMETVNDVVYIKISNSQSLESFKINSTGLKLNCLTTRNIVIDCIWSKRPNTINSYYVSFLNYTIYSSNWNMTSLLDTMANPFRRRRSVDSMLSKSVREKRLVKSNPDTYEYTSYATGNYRIYDVYLFANGSKAHFYVNSTQFSLYLPKDQWNRSTGILINGLKASITITPVTTTTTSTATTSTRTTSNTTTSTTITSTTSAKSSSNRLKTTYSYFLPSFILVFIFKVLY